MLTREDGGTNRGAFGRAIRNMSDQEFDSILMAGYSRTLGEVDKKAFLEVPALGNGAGFEEAGQAAFEIPLVERRIVQQLVSRPFREQAFVQNVKSAYENTCAMTGLKIINGGGRAEVQAAHIIPVKENGPDSVRNGLALSGTIHWMFDRNLMTIDDDFSLIVAKDKVPDTIGRMLNPNGKLRLPNRRDLWPQKQFLRHHQMRFKG